MDEPGSLEALQLLHKDLLALSASKYQAIDLLRTQLDNHIEEFRKLFKKKENPPNPDRTEKLSNGKINLRGGEYEINQEFQQGALQLADALNIDEIEAAQLFLDSEDEAKHLGRSRLEASIIRFHQIRKYMLDCLRIVLELSLGTGQGKDVLEDHRVFFQQWIGRALNAPQFASQFLRRCLIRMADNREWLQRLTNRINSASVLGQSQISEFSEILQFQRLSLVREHEVLGVIVFYLIKANHSALTDLEFLLGIVKRIDKFDNLLVHHFPAVAASIQAWIRSDGSPLSLDQIQPHHNKFFGVKDDQSWTLHYVYASISALWLSEYITWYDENSPDPLLANVNIAEVRNTLSEKFIEAIKEGAFDFFMSMCAEVRSVSWQDPAQHEISEWIDHKGGSLSLPWQRMEHTTRSASSDKEVLTNPITFAEYFQVPFMEQMETFIDVFICNAPNVLRKMRHDEDEQRQLGHTHDCDLNLEKFLVIISFVFEGRHNAALQSFWSDPDSHMHGFLVWASKRASTALASAFNGMLRAISGNPECANAAHKFLLDESASSSGKMRRAQCLSWDFILSELKYFTGKLNERPALLHATFYRTGKPHGDQDETEALAAESSLRLLLLQTYLHLVTRLCTQSLEARRFLLDSASFDIVEQMYKLISIPTPQLPSLLRGCAFNVLESLSISKTREVSDGMWNAVEFWRSGGYFTPSNLPKVSTVGSTYNPTMDDVLSAMETGFEQANAFVRLLNVLVMPEEVGGVNDLLPFPEGLGSSSRMPGIFDYVDFVMRVFGNKTYDKSATKKTREEINEMRVLRCTCLNFISTCLTTFNEDLLVFAEQSHIQVENSMRTSSLENYVRLHPFARVMEWLFNDLVMEALFTAVEQDIEEVGNAEPNSPLVLSLLDGIITISTILDMQQTYLSRVRPSIKKEPTHRRIPVSNAAYTSFEDGILKHLSIVANLGRYCTTNHSDLTIASLKLLEQLSTSPKLVSPMSVGPERRLDRNKVVVALELHDETESISKALTDHLHPNNEFDEDPNSPQYEITASILHFLNTCIESLPNRPTAAHLLLGFQCTADALDVDDERPLGQQTSLFHKILELPIIFPLGMDPNSVSSSFISIKNSCLQLLGSLWTSSLSSAFVTRELRGYDLLTHLVLKEPIVQVDTLWDGRMRPDPDFMYESSATALSSFLVHRASIFKFIAIELRLLATERAPTYKQKIINTLLGATILPDGEHIVNNDVFSLFDFMELEIEEQSERPELQYLDGLDLRMCHETIGLGESFNIHKVDELIRLRIMELESAGQATNPEFEAQINAEGQQLLSYLRKINHLESLRIARSIALQAWVQLMCMIVESGGLGANKMGFVLQSLQLILPKLEKYSSENPPEAIDLARLAKTLLFSLDFGSQALDVEQNPIPEAANPVALQRRDTAEATALERRNLTAVASERLFSLFRISIRAINTPMATAPFKQIFYNICYKYLTGIVHSTSISAISQRQQCIKIIKLAGDRLTEILCDDAYAGEQECRISALLMLSALVTLVRQGGEREHEDSRLVILSLEQFNFIGILVDSIQNMPNELRDTSEQDTTSQVVYCKAKLSLLLQIAQTRYGASQILNARLFRSVQNSGLFSMDPDLGMDIVIPNQEKVYYELLLAIIRVINACVVSRGAQNEHTLEEGRKFVRDSQTSMMTVMKKHAGIGAVNNALEMDIGDLAEAYMLLISVTDFLKSEEKVTRSARPKVFT